MVRDEQVREILEQVLVPGAMRSLVKLNLVHDIIIADRKVNVILASAALNAGVQDRIKTSTKELLEKLPDVDELDIKFTDIKPEWIGREITVRGRKAELYGFAAKASKYPYLVRCGNGDVFKVTEATIVKQLSEETASAA